MDRGMAVAADGCAARAGTGKYHSLWISRARWWCAACPG